MIVIKNIDFFETDMDPVEVYDNCVDPTQAEFCVELIKGRKFTRPDGEKVVVAASKQAQDVLGLLYEAWEDLEKRFTATQNAYYKTWMCLEAREIELSVYKNASFRQRIKYLFRGKL